MARKRKINLVKGIIGALVGLIPGMLIWFILFNIGLNGVISSFFMGLGSFIGFRLMGRRIDKNGAIASFIVVILGIWITNRICSALELYNIFNGYYSFGKCFFSLMSALKISGTVANYFLNIFLGIIISIFGLGIVLYKEYDE